MKEKKKHIRGVQKGENKPYDVIKKHEGEKDLKPWKTVGDLFDRTNLGI